MGQVTLLVVPGRSTGQASSTLHPSILALSAVVISIEDIVIAGKNSTYRASHIFTMRRAVWFKKQHN